MISRSNAPKLFLIILMATAAVVKAVDPRFTIGGDRFRTPLCASLFWVILLSVLICVPWADEETAGATRSSAVHQVRMQE